MNMPDHFTTPTPGVIARAARRGPLRRAFGRLFAQGNDGGPPDLEEMWRDFTRRLGSFFGVQKKGGDIGPGGGGGFQPDVKSAWIGVALIGAIVAIVWLFSGSFIVQEGQRAVVTTFGKYTRTVEPGWGWRLPYPIQQHEIVDFTLLKTAEIGGTGVNPATGLRDSSMLTQDENIVDVRFNVQYRLSDAQAYLFANKDPGIAVTQASESAVREIVGRSPIDSVLYKQRDALASDLVKSIKAQLDKLNAGILIVNVNVENVGVPEQVTAEFNDALKANADRDRFKNDGRAYASDIIPKAQGDAARLLADAEGYKARIVGAAEGDANRFKAVLAEYQKAPAVTRDRMYIDAMRDIYENVTKVMVDTHGGNNLIQVPIDRLVQAGAASASQAPAQPSAAGAAPAAEAQTVTVDPRTRDNPRGRDRDGR
jgi:membrane protease subunit HflK